MGKTITTAGQKTINQNGLSSLPIWLPPLEEQKRIVAKVNQLMALCDELEAKLRQTEADSEKLMKAAVRDLLQIVNQKYSEEALATLA
jgi:type I restriction enzyme S subunit